MRDMWTAPSDRDYYGEAPWEREPIRPGDEVVPESVEGVEADCEF